MLRRNLLKSIILLVLLFMNMTLFAQDDQTDPFLQEPEQELADDFTIDWGIIIDVYVLDSNASDENFSLINDTRLWFNFIFSEDTYLYVRGRNYLQWTPNPSPLLQRDKVEDSFDLDRLFFHTQNKTMSLTVGRDRYNLGLGIVFNNNSDGAAWSFYTGAWSFKVIANYSGLIRKDFDSFKQSVDDFESGSQRIFSGAKIGLYLYPNQNFYVGFMHQRDVHSYEAIANDEYQSYYAFFGWTNELAQDFFFMGEFIYEFGYSTGGDESISAYAVDARFRYFIGTDAKLALLLQYALASGDNDRTNVVIGRGNVIGKDKAFKAFGQYYTGFVFRPKFSNLQIIRFAIEGRPLFFAGIFEKLHVAIHYAAYFKQVKDGVTSDSDILDNEWFIGQAVDIFLNWRMASDLNYILKAGIFFKGPAFQTSTMLGQFFTGFQLRL